MNPSHSPPDPAQDSHWLDASLEEVLGGRRPPDLSARILQALRAAHGEPEAPPIVVAAASSPPASPTLPATPALKTTRPAAGRPGAARSLQARSAAAPTSPAMAAATLAIAGIGAGLLAYLVGRESVPAPMSSMARAVPSASSSASDRAAVEKKALEKAAEKARRSWQGSERVAVRPQPKHTPSPSRDAASAESAADAATSAGAEAQAAASAVAESPLDEAQLVAWMNEQLRQSWQAAGVAPAERATDEEWCRRVFLRLLGRIPTIEEVQAFAADKRADKRAQWATLVMAADSKYAAEFATHWAEIWANALVGRKVDNQLQATAREQLVGFLKRELMANRSFDSLAYELISATGSNSPNSDDYNAAVNFLLAHADGKATEATARVSRVFLGRNLQQEPRGAGSDAEDTSAQQQFWQLNAFFRQMQVERLEGGAARLVNRDFRGDGQAARDPSDAAVYYELGDGKLRAAYPVFLDGAELPHSGLVGEVDRRRELARRVAQSPEFRRTVVNRLWAHFLGFGIVNPIDDLSPQNEASHPELLERLAGQFAAHGYDMRQAVRWIVLSESFSLSSKTGAGELADAPEQGRTPLFSRYYARPMPAEQVYESLKLLAGVRKNGGSNGGSASNNSGSAAANGIAARELGRRDFLGRVTKRGGLEQPNDLSIIETVPQSLIKVDGELPQRVLSGEQGSLLEKVAADKRLKPDEKIERLFQASLARRPTPQELQAARELLKLSPNDPLIGLRDLWWALLNSNEFLIDR
ncbi:MAG: DUF1553 domain-containing protein [Pirellulales bacterium]